MNQISNKQLKKHIKRFLFIVFVLFLISFSIYLLFFGDATYLVSMIGIENTYAIMFFLTLFTGLSSFGAGIIYTSLITFISGGADPLYIGLATGIGMGLGDMFFFFVFSQGHSSLPHRLQSRIEKIKEYLEKKDPRIIPFFILGWTMFTPFPNDVMSFSVSMIGYPFRRAWRYILSGDIIHMVGFSLIWGTFVT